MATPEPFDAILIGAGQAANPLARSLAQPAGRSPWSERAEIGGTCVNWGCTPTKTMVASAHAWPTWQAGPATTASTWTVWPSGCTKFTGANSCSSRNSGPGANANCRRRKD